MLYLVPLATTLPAIDTVVVMYYYPLLRLVHCEQSVSVDVYCLQHLEKFCLKIFFQSVGYAFMYENGFIFTGKLLLHFNVS